MTRRTSALALVAVIAASLLGMVLATTIPSSVFPEIMFRRATILAERGWAEVEVNFGEGGNPLSSFELLVTAVDETLGRLPPDTTIDSLLLTTGTFPIVDISLSSKLRSLAELTDIANYDLVPSLHR